MVRAAERTFEPRDLEARMAKLWASRDAYHRTKAHRAGGAPHYFLDGPPYATGHIHIGTARNKVLKDVYVRHMRQRGFDVRDQPGFDMHGLPIEVKVEKDLGITSKKDIEAYGIDRFVEACRTFAVDHLRIMTEEFRALAIWMDWDKPYMTITNDYIEGAWWAIEQAHERGLLTRNERVLPWCWRCEAPLANAEVEFEDREDPSAYVKFALKDRPGEFLVVWTTTPWTLPANVAVAVHPDIVYARMRVDRQGKTETWLVAEAQAEAVARIARAASFEIVQRLPGRDLEGLRYEHAFAPEVRHHQTPASEWNNRVLLGDHVVADRTGLVHTATGHGVEDFDVGKKYGVAVFSPVGEDGRYTDAAGPLAGLAVKSPAGSPADERVLQLLRERDLLVAAKPEKHAYGHCWRCKNPILFRATSQWFIDVPRVKAKMIEETKRVVWTPEWAGSARQLDWVEGARDWCISRQRYWGIPLPVWECTAAGCHETLVVGSRKQLHQVSPDVHGHHFDLHRPWIDKVRVVCPRRGCGGMMKRVPDVLDVWFDSAVAAWASLGYPHHREAHQKYFPAAWICEGLDQTRGWFYSQLAAGVAAMGRVPYERVVMHGWVHDERGRPMSKSLGNIVSPTDVIAKHGADALRMGIVLGAAPWEDISFGDETVRAAKRSLNILWNVHVFATSYMAADGWRPGPRPDPDLLPEDRWLLSRLQTTVAETTHHLEASEFHRAGREIERFVLDDLSRWYVRLVRERVWDEGEAPGKRAAFSVLHEALLTTARLLAPFAPHVAEAVYQDLTEGHAHPTVHMEDWPVADATLTDYDLERDMASVRAAVDAAAYARQKANMKLRWPVAKLVVATDDADVRNAVHRFRATFLEQANAKDVELVGADWEHLLLVAVPNKSMIGKTYRAQGPAVLQRLAALDQDALRRLRLQLAAGDAASLDVDGLQVALTPDLLAFQTSLPAHTSGADFQGGSVYVDTDVTPALQAEGTGRDLTRRIQEMRKLLGLPMDATIATEVAAPADLAALVAPVLADVQAATRSARFDLVDKPQGTLVREWDLEDATITIGIRDAAHAPTPSAPAPAKSTPKAPLTNPTRSTPPTKAKTTKAAPPKARKKASAKKAPAAKKATKKAGAKKAAPKKANPKKANPKKANPKKANPKKANPKKANPKKPPTKGRT